MGLHEIVNGDEELVIDGKPRWTSSVDATATPFTIEKLREAYLRAQEPPPRPHVHAVSKSEFASLLEAGWINEAGHFIR